MKHKSVSIPYLFWALIFIIVPLLIVCYFALTNGDGEFTLRNLTQVAGYRNVIANSIFLGLIATGICLLLGYPTAYIIANMSGAKQSTFLLLAIMPMWMNFLLRTFAWMTLLEDTGLINRFLGAFNIGPFHMINTKGSVVLGMVYNFLPFMIMPIYTVLTKMDQSIVEAAEDLGANRRTVFSRVILPTSVPGIITGFTMVFVPAVSTFLISQMLGGNSNLLIGDLIEMQFTGQSYNPNLGAAISLVLMVLILISMGVMYRFADNEDGMMMGGA